MINAIYAGQNKDQFQKRTELFHNQDIQITPATSGEMACRLITELPCDLLITEDHLKDMSGKALIEKSVSQNPFLNCVAISALSHEAFHEEFEGLGVLMQLPYDLNVTDIKNLKNHLKTISGLFVSQIDKP